MKRKAFLTILIISFVYIFGSLVLAAPRSIDPEYKGTADIINVTNPDDGMATFKDHAVVSVTGDEGVIITLYVYDNQTDTYVLYTQENGENSWFVGPSGFFVKRLPIITGINHIGIFAEFDGYDQFITRSVTREKNSIRNHLKSLLIKNIQDVFNNVQSK